jgi:methylthioribulose-1-phosphate dehydratase/2,3-diketo-5-methylthio-1-phosphopentane phosphatase
MSLSAVPDVFFLDDPQDGASDYLLRELGVSLSRGVIPGGAASAQPFESAYEHALGFDAVYSVPGAGGALLDVRDSADAWVRIILHSGDSAVVAAGKWRRVPSKAEEVLAPWARALAAWRECGLENDDIRVRASSRSMEAHIVGRLRAPSSQGVVVVTAAQVPGAEQKSEIAGLPAPRFSFFGNTAEQLAADAPFFTRPGLNGHTRELVSELCASFYTLGWVTGTGGSISVRIGGRIFMAPSGVQKERMQPADIFVLDGAGSVVYAPRPLPGKPTLRLSQCSPLFQHAFTLRNAGAAIHTHDINAVLVTLLAGDATEFRITHQEMIKGIAGHGFTDECVVPIIENTPHEADLADSLGEAMRAYPRANAVLVRRHGVYVWGSDWIAAKGQAECYHYLFEAAVRMRAIGLDPAAVPQRVVSGIGAERSYGSGAERATSYGNSPDVGGIVTPALIAEATKIAHEHAGGCCVTHSSSEIIAPTAGAEAAVAEGWHGSAGTSSLKVPEAAIAPKAEGLVSTKAVCASLNDYSFVVLDVEGCTTSLSFVTETLFPYAAAHTKSWLESAWASGAADAKADVASLEALSLSDVASNVAGAAEAAISSGTGAAWGVASAGSDEARALIDAVCKNVAWQMSSGRKSGALKGLQGHVWRAGYESGAIVGQLFEDVLPALKAWTSAGKKVYIYSSGSREAQRLLFQYSNSGDVRSLLSGYFDTKTGPKLEAPSYTEIALSVGAEKPTDVLFATDSLGEAAAASAAGIRVIVTDRPGNNALPEDGITWPIAATLLEIAEKKD